MSIKLLALDLDGTIVDSAPDISHCLGLALEAVGLPLPGEARTRLWIGDGVKSLVQRALAHATQDERIGGSAARREWAVDQYQAVLKSFLSCYGRNVFVRSRLYPDVAQTLDALRARGIQLCCITNKDYDLSHELLTRAGIRDRFEIVFGGDSLPEKKPSPLPLTTAANRLGFEATESALVGDSLQDLRAATGAGFDFILATYGYGKVNETESVGTALIRGFCELDTLLT